MATNLTSMNMIQKIDRSAIESTRLAIFNNAAEKAKAKATNNYSNEAYTSSMRTEVMAQARQTISAPALNFFKTGVKETSKASVSTQDNPYQSSQQQKSNIDKSKQPMYIREQQLSKDVNIAAMHESVMIQARDQMANKDSFQANLKFLNSKAAVETLKNRPLL